MDGLRFDDLDAVLEIFFQFFVGDDSLGFNLDFLIGQSSIFNLLQGIIHLLLERLVNFLQKEDTEVHIGEILMEQLPVVKLCKNVLQSLGDVGLLNRFVKKKSVDALDHGNAGWDSAAVFKFFC